MADILQFTELYEQQETAWKNHIEDDKLGDPNEFAEFGWPDIRSAFVTGFDAGCKSMLEEVRAYLQAEHPHFAEHFVAKFCKVMEE